MVKVLIVDDNIDMLDTLEHLFTFYDFEVVRAENGKEGIEIAEQEQPGLIILDALMPVMNGFEACEKLKNNTKTREIPVIFLSANYTKLEHQQRGLELGADDYILKPFNAQELISKVNSLLHRRQLIDELRKDNKALLERNSQVEAHQAMEKKSERAETDPSIDPLTGIYNEQFFFQRLEIEHQRYRKAAEELAITLIDVDLFLEVNKIYGEQTADYVLMKLANVILHNCRAFDFVFRLKKHKFAIILPKISESDAFDQAEKIRKAIFHTQFFDQDFFELNKISHKLKQTLRDLTVSVGIAGLEHGVAHGDLFRRAQDALNNAKTRGRNNTIRYSEMV
jgi:diguanylate cyclase (GGDEF)-like protein